MLPVVIIARIVILLSAWAGVNARWARCQGQRLPSGWAPCEPRLCHPSRPPPADLPIPPPAHDVAQLLQVGGREVPLVAVTPLHVLLDAVQVHRVQVQELRLQTQGTGRKEQLHPNSSQRWDSKGSPSSLLALSCCH